MTDVTIRGIDDDTYTQFAAEAKRRGVPIGELATQAMKAMISDTSAPSYRIGNLEDLSVSKSDLESVEGTAIFENIENLSFDDTIDWPTFNQRVKSIANVETITLPRSLSKFQVLTKSKNVQDIRAKQ
jgi:post-segregation antitoxin (ccd killing protein)